MQVEAYLDKKKAYFSTGIYVLPSQWDAQKAKIVRHPNEEALNRFLQELLMTYEQKELLAWKQGKQIDLNLFKTSKPPKTESLVGIGRKFQLQGQHSEEQTNDTESAGSVPFVRPIR